MLGLEASRAQLAPTEKSRATRNPQAKTLAPTVEGLAEARRKAIVLPLIR